MCGVYARSDDANIALDGNAKTDECPLIRIIPSKASGVKIARPVRAGGSSAETRPRRSARAPRRHCVRRPLPDANTIKPRGTIVFRYYYCRFYRNDYLLSDRIGVLIPSESFQFHNRSACLRAVVFHDIFPGHNPMETGTRRINIIIRVDGVKKKKKSLNRIILFLRYCTFLINVDTNKSSFFLNIGFISYAFEDLSNETMLLK